MAFWYRIKPSKLKALPTQFKRCYFQIPGPCLANHAGLLPKSRVLEKPNSALCKSYIEFSINVRFFAAPVQVKPKKEERDSSGPRLNEQIRADVVRLVTDEGHRVVSRSEALELARNLKLDLVEVQRDAKPPVCKVMDYHKEKYKQQIREKERAKSKSEVTLRKGDCKEVRFSCKTEQKDLQIKADTVKRLIERGYRVKCMAQGTEEQDLGQLLSRLSALIEDISVVESGPRVEKKQAYIIVRHVKFGPSKKGSAKKASKVSSTTSPEVQNIATSTPSIKHLIHSEEILDPAEPGLETEDEILSEEEDSHTPPSLEMPDKVLDNKNPSWSVFGANDEFDGVFDFRDDNTKIASSSELGTENRYRREPKKGTSARDAMRSMPPFPNQRRQPQFGLNPSPSGRENSPGETNGALVGNLKIPANDIPKHEQSHARAPAPRSPVSGFGIFSASEGKDASEKNSVPAENRYKKGSTFDSTRQPWPRGVSARQNSPTSNMDGGGRPGVDKRWEREMGNVR